MGNGPHHRVLTVKAPKTMARESGTNKGKATGIGPRHAPTVTSVALRCSETRGPYTVATFAGRPIIKWTRYGYYDERGNLTMTRVL